MLTRWSANETIAIMEICFGLSFLKRPFKQFQFQWLNNAGQSIFRSVPVPDLSRARIWISVPVPQFFRAKIRISVPVPLKISSRDGSCPVPFPFTAPRNVFMVNIAKNTPFCRSAKSSVLAIVSTDFNINYFSVRPNRIFSVQYDENIRKLFYTCCFLQLVDLKIIFKLTCFQNCRNYFPNFH